MSILRDNMQQPEVSKHNQKKMDRILHANRGNRCADRCAEFMRPAMRVAAIEDPFVPVPLHGGGALGLLLPVFSMDPGTVEGETCFYTVVFLYFFLAVFPSKLKKSIWMQNQFSILVYL